MKGRIISMSWYKSWFGNILCLVVAEAILFTLTLTGTFEFVRGGEALMWIIVLICMALVLLLWLINALVFYRRYNKCAQYDDARYQKQKTINFSVIGLSLLVFAALAATASIGVLLELFKSLVTNSVAIVSGNLYALLGITFLLLCLEFFVMACVITCENRPGLIWKTLGKYSDD